MSTLDKNAPYLPPVYKDSDVAAIQALAEGKATDVQQKQALTWVIEELCKTYDMSYRPNSPRDTDFAEGKRYVGNHLILMTKIKIGQLKEAK